MGASARMIVKALISPAKNITSAATKISMPSTLLATSGVFSDSEARRSRPAVRALRGGKRETSG
jgi:hypothetical protein